MYILSAARRERTPFQEGDAYLNQIPSIAGLERLDLSAPVCIFAGENGMGKSTLLEALAVSFGFNPEGGTRNFNFATKATHSGLHDHLLVAKGIKRPRDGFFLRAESFYNVSSEIDRLDEDFSFGPRLSDSYGGRSLHERSHGEGFWALVMHRFSGGGLYMMDEPESALSPMRQLALLSRMQELIKKNSQFIIATHSPILMAYPGALIYEFTGDGIQKREYDEAENVQVMKAFMQNPERMLRMMGIFEEEADERD